MNAYAQCIGMILAGTKAQGIRMLQDYTLHTHTRRYTFTHKMTHVHTQDDTHTHTRRQVHNKMTHIHKQGDTRSHENAVLFSFMPFQILLFLCHEQTAYSYLQFESIAVPHNAILNQAL